MAINFSPTEKLQLSELLDIPQGTLATIIDSGKWDGNYFKFSTLIDIAPKAKTLHGSVSKVNGKIHLIYGFIFEGTEYIAHGWDHAPVEIMTRVQFDNK